MEEIYARMNDDLTMAHAARRAEASWGKLAQLKADILAAEQAQDWINSFCWWLHYCSYEQWDTAQDCALDTERARTA